MIRYPLRYNQRGLNEKLQGNNPMGISAPWDTFYLNNCFEAPKCHHH